MHRAGEDGGRRRQRLLLEPHHRLDLCAKDDSDVAMDADDEQGMANEGVDGAALAGTVRTANKSTVPKYF